MLRLIRAISRQGYRNWQSFCINGKMRLSYKITRFLLGMAACLLTASCAMQSARMGPERFNIDLASYGYELGHSANTAMVSTNEYVVKGDSVKDWETLVTEFHSSSYISPKVMAGQIAKGINDDCPGSKIRRGSLPNDAYFVEFSHNGCGKWEGHHSIRKIIRGEGGLYMISFDMKKRAFDAAVYSEWKKRILAVDLVRR